MSKASLPKGMRDFMPGRLARRNYIIDTIKKHFERYGFAPIETPAMEKLSTLTGKYGNEGDRLIFKVLNSGDYLRKAPQDVLDEKDSRKLTPYIAEKALRYDLTVPLARFTVQHRNDLVFPFKRYQIQPVWRADRPQKGRFREFYQCDADILGSRSLWQDVELVHLYDDVFSALNIPVDIRINNRKILTGLVEALQIRDKEQIFLTALDKWDKIGDQGVRAEMEKGGIPATAFEKFLQVASATPGEQLPVLKDLFASSETGQKGLEELKTVMERVEIEGLQKSALVFDLTLARGLDYYTGSIFEVRARDVQMGSIGGGGRYDDLTGIFGLPGVSGIGISFGLDRIELVMDELGLLDDIQAAKPEVLFLNFGEAEASFVWPFVQQLRKRGIAAELYPDAVKLRKQMQYADRRGIRYVIMIGDREMENRQFVLKNMTEGTQETWPLDQLYAKIKA